MLPKAISVRFSVDANVHRFAWDFCCDPFAYDVCVDPRPYVGLVPSLGLRVHLAEDSVPAHRGLRPREQKPLLLL